MAAAVLVVGASFGAIAVASGVSLGLVMAMSALVFAGGAQFMAIGVLASGGSAVAALAAALLLNVRHLPFGMAVADVLGERWASRLVGSHLLIDESVAFALAQRDQARRRAAYWACGVALFLAWNVGSVLGALAGQAVGDPAALGLDAAFPAGLLALLLPSLRDSQGGQAGRQAGGGAGGRAGGGAGGRTGGGAGGRAGAVALLGAAVALATTPLLPAGLPVLLALVGLLAAVRWREPAERRR